MVVTGAVFVHGPLSRPPVIGAIAGDVPATSATADGMMLTCDPDDPLALSGIVPGQGGVEGRLLPAGRAAERAAFVAEVLGGHAWRTIVVTHGRTSCTARSPAGIPGMQVRHSGDGAAGNADVLFLAVQEVLEQMHLQDAATLAARRPMILSRAAARVAARQSSPADLRSSMQASEVETLGRETLHAGFFLTRAYRLRHPRFDKTPSPELRREVFVATDAALVLPYDPRRDRVLLVEQFRMGPFGRGDPMPWLLEPVAGRIDAGETPQQAAHRECLEEAGVHLNALEPISSHYSTPGYSTELFHLFLGLCNLPDPVTGQGGLDSEHEDIRTHVIGFDRAMALLRSGEANNGPLVLSLLWLERERARLRASA